MTVRRITCDNRKQRDSIIESFTVRNRRGTLDVTLIPSDLDIMVAGNRSHIPHAVREIRFLIEEQTSNLIPCETCGLVHDGPICPEQY